MTMIRALVLRTQSKVFPIHTQCFILIGFTFPPLYSLPPTPPPFIPAQLLYQNTPFIPSTA
jgi:hypothetical protein